MKRAELRLRAKFCQIRSNRGQDRTIFRFFQDGGRPPSWICYACVGTTHEWHLVVFITVQNVVGINAVVLIICTFFDFASLAWKRLFTPQNCFYLEVDFLNGGQCEKSPKRHTFAQFRVVWAIMRENPSMRLTCRWIPQKRGINKNKFGYISPMCPVGVADIITCDKFVGDRLRDVDSVGGRKLSFPIDKASRR